MLNVKYVNVDLCGLWLWVWWRCLFVCLFVSLFSYLCYLRLERIHTVCVETSWCGLFHFTVSSFFFLLSVVFSQSPLHFTFHMESTTNVLGKMYIYSHPNPFYKWNQQPTRFSFLSFSSIPHSSHWTALNNHTK